MAKSSFRLRRLREKMDHGEKMLRRAHHCSYRTAERKEWSAKVAWLNRAIAEEIVSLSRPG